VTADGALRGLFTLVVGAVLTAFAVLLVTGGYHNEGPVLLQVADEHGVHQGDVFVLTGWAAGLLSLSGLWVRRRR
jgi:hypothetical protein